MTTAIIAGSFDPLTNGHIDLVDRSLRICEQVIIVVGVNPNKKTLFTEGERVKLISSVFDSLLFSNVKVFSYPGLLVDVAKINKPSILVRGVRAVSDFEYEMNLAHINKVLAPDIDTVFLPTSPELSIISSSMVKEIARHSGDISGFVPDLVAEAVYAKLKK